MLRYWWVRLLQLLCRHDMRLYVQWAPDEICLMMFCGKCGKGKFHTHLPSKEPTKAKEFLH